MKKFEFKLQKLLDMREAREKEIQNELMKLLSIQNKERVLQDELRKKITFYEQQYAESLRKGRFAGHEMMALLRYADVSRRAIDEAQNRIDEMEPEISEVRARLVQASTERKIVEKLKERKQEEYNYEVEKEIARENDDMNQKLYLRRQMQEGTV